MIMGAILPAVSCKDDNLTKHRKHNPKMYPLVIVYNKCNLNAVTSSTNNSTGAYNYTVVIM